MTLHCADWAITALQLNALHDPCTLAQVCTMLILMKGWIKLVCRGAYILYGPYGSLFYFFNDVANIQLILNILKWKHIKKELFS